MLQLILSLSIILNIWIPFLPTAGCEQLPYNPLYSEYDNTPNGYYYHVIYNDRCNVVWVKVKILYPDGTTRWSRDVRVDQISGAELGPCIELTRSSGYDFWLILRRYIKDQCGDIIQEQIRVSFVDFYNRPYTVERRPRQIP